jgi:hypothetical protein
MRQKMSERERIFQWGVLQLIALLRVLRVLRVDGVTQKRWSDSLHQHQIFERHHENYT